MHAKSLYFSKFHYVKANPLTSVEIHTYNSEQNLASNVKAIKQNEKTKLFVKHVGPSSYGLSPAISH